MLESEPWMEIKPHKYFAPISIPKDWENLEDFVMWYLKQRMPLMIPYDARVMTSDDAVAICVFRSGHYQVELYLEYPGMYIRKHSHPRMEVITMMLGGGNNSPPNPVTKTSKFWGTIQKKLMPGEYHGGEPEFSTGEGFALLAFQRWENIEEMTSASVQWKGEIQGDRQKDLILKYKPDAFIESTHADVSHQLETAKPEPRVFNPPEK